MFVAKLVSVSLLVSYLASYSLTLITLHISVCDVHARLTVCMSAIDVGMCFLADSMLSLAGREISAIQLDLHSTPLTSPHICR